MTPTYLVSDNIFSPLGQTTAENMAQLKKGRSGIALHEDERTSAQGFYAALFPKNGFILPEEDHEKYTKFEQLLIASIQNALQNTPISLQDQNTILIISTTKGSISLLETQPNSAALQQRVALSTAAQLVGQYFRVANRPVVVSNACISGVLALILAHRMLQSGQYKHAVVAGADVISKFILSGFQSFMAVSTAPCQPFDAARSGVTLGEGAGTMVLSTQQQHTPTGVKIAGGAISNDANHISGPSRTGDGLAQAISGALRQSSMSNKDIDFVSAHGTATLFNDEMEANALYLSHLEDVPVNSLKGYYGHTLGAAGLIESIVTIHSLNENMILPTANFRQLGVSKPIKVTSQFQTKLLHNCLKTASGFGGCNAAVIFG